MNYEDYMQKAIELAEMGRGRTNPNPLVGAIVVRDGAIVGEGYHAALGEPHAEIVALGQAEDRAKGALLFSTLEPCCTFGRTPPCTRTIISSGVAKVVIGLVDPNPQVNGKGLEEIHRSGIEVFTGVLSKEIARQNEIYLKYITTGQPFVLLKTAMSLNGKIARESGRTTWITGAVSRQEVHCLRDQYDAIMVGSGTVLADNPLLTARLKNKETRNPVRVIVDSQASLPIDARVVTDPSALTVLATTEKAPKEKLEELQRRGVQVLLLPEANGKVDLTKLMEELGKREITSILLEGGASLNTSAIEAGIVDKFAFFIAPKVIGGKQALGVVKDGFEDLLWQELKLSRLRKMGEDFMVEAYPK